MQEIENGTRYFVLVGWPGLIVPVYNSWLAGFDGKYL